MPVTEQSAPADQARGSTAAQRECPPEPELEDPVSFEADSIDALRRLIRGFQLDFIQLDPGAFRAEVVQRLVGTALLTSACFTRRLFQRGVPPPDTLTFALRTSPAPATWHGEPFGEDDLLFGTSGAEIDLVSARAYSVALASFGIEAAREAQDTFGYPDVLQPATWSLVRLTPAEATALRGQLGELLQRAGKPGFGSERYGARPEASAPTTQLPTSSPAAERIEELLGAFLLKSGRSDRRGPAPLTERQRIIKAALPAIMDATEVRPDVADLCRIARTNERTLHRAFIERFGVPPARFIKLQRLNRARAALYEAHPSTKILDFANRLDFWHMSQFARDYRQLFGELPSQTFGRLSRH